MLKKIIDNLKTLIIALLIAVIIRSLLFQPHIPSSSMEPTLLVGQNLYQNILMVTLSILPFSPPIFKIEYFN